MPFYSRRVLVRQILNFGPRLLATPSNESNFFFKFGPRNSVTESDKFLFFGAKSSIFASHQHIKEKPILHGSFTFWFEPAHCRDLFCGIVGCFVNPDKNPALQGAHESPFSVAANAS